MNFRIAEKKRFDKSSFRKIAQKIKKQRNTALKL